MMLPKILIVIGIIILFFATFLWIGERGKLLLPSTRRFIGEGGENLINLNSFHGYVYMRWQKFYLSILINKIGSISPQKLRAWLADRYHAKILTDEQAKDFILLNEPIQCQRIVKKKALIGFLWRL